ncbi:hypothetical protein ACROYT_G007014 [Oculina patagonica]
MKCLITLFVCLVITCQLSIAASNHDSLKSHGRIPASQEIRDSPIVSNTRSVLDFGLLIICGTGRNPFDYNGYGCFCGIGGHGTPVDDTDRCCQVHDDCYTAVSNSGSCPFSWAVYAIPYSRKECYGCEPASYYWFYGKCRHALCKCDSEAVQCFKRSKFNPSFMNYSRDKC